MTKYTRDTLMKKARISDEQLNAIYKKWISPQLQTGYRSLYTDDINRVSFRYGPGKQFEDYVWSCGGRIGKEHGKRYAEFFEEEDLIMFTLKHM